MYININLSGKYGNELFGFAIGKYYIGYYADGWTYGKLNQHECI